ncbi:MAG: paraquat-inducible protein A [Cellvibrionaceae bacterium]|nr:paraquat-inducible protein A [Cellvibrionaceae bacterium]
MSPAAVQPETEKHDLLLCRDCGKLQAIAPISAKQELRCSQCNSVLHRGVGEWLQVACALAITAAVLFVCSVSLPFITLEVGPQSQTATILDGFWALMERQQWVLAGLVITTVFVFPLFEIFAFLYLLIPYSFNRHLPQQHLILRWLRQVQSWSMLEVFMLSVLVASVKLADMAVLRMEIGFYMFTALVMVLILAWIKMDRSKLWTWIQPHNYFIAHDGEQVYDCRVCHAMVGESLIDRHNACPRCLSVLHKRIPKSLEKSTAFLIAAVLLYIPSNVLPIMTYATLGDVATDTILSGVIELVAAGLWGIALVVFTASIVVPIAKILILAYLILSVKVGMKRGIKHRAWLYRFIEFVGRWSMVDVYVVTMLVALVQFGFVYTVEPEGAIIAFGVVVVLTMIAAESFDPRLLWDALDESSSE